MNELEIRDLLVARRDVRTVSPGDVEAVRAVGDRRRRALRLRLAAGCTALALFVALAVARSASTPPNVGVAADPQESLQWTTERLGAQPSPEQVGTFIAAAGGNPVVVADRGDGSARVWVRQDGRWHRGPQLSGRVQGAVTTADGRAVAALLEADAINVWVSRDGTSGTTSKLPLEAAASPDPFGLQIVAGGESLLIVATRTPPEQAIRAFRSADNGGTWSRVAFPPLDSQEIEQQLIPEPNDPRSGQLVGPSLTTLSGGPRGFASVINQSGRREGELWLSEDGVAWTRMAADGANTVIGVRQGWILVDSTSPGVWTLVTPSERKQVPAPPKDPDESLDSVLASGDLMIAYVSELPPLRFLTAAHDITIAPSVIVTDRRTGEVLVDAADAVYEPSENGYAQFTIRRRSTGAIVVALSADEAREALSAAGGPPEFRRGTEALLSVDGGGSWRRIPRPPGEHSGAVVVRNKVFVATGDGVAVLSLQPGPRP